MRRFGGGGARDPAPLYKLPVTGSLERHSRETQKQDCLLRNYVLTLARKQGISEPCLIWIVWVGPEWIPERFALGKFLRFGRDLSMNL